MELKWWSRAYGDAAERRHDRGDPGDMMERIDTAPDTVVSRAGEKVNDGLKVLRAKNYAMLRIASMRNIWYDY